MKFYRLENQNVGPYVQGHGPVRHARKPQNFKKGDNPDDFIYGCLSREALESYFTHKDPGKFQDLLDRGFQVKEYNVKRRHVRFISDHEVAVHMAGVEGYPKNPSEWRNERLDRFLYLLKNPPFSDSGHV